MLRKEVCVIEILKTILKVLNIMPESPKAGRYHVYSCVAPILYRPISSLLWYKLFHNRDVAAVNTTTSTECSCSSLVNLLVTLSNNNNCGWQTVLASQRLFVVIMPPSFLSTYFSILKQTSNWTALRTFTSRHHLIYLPKIKIWANKYGVIMVSA